jgi:CHAT domain-containing protein
LRNLVPIAGDPSGEPGAEGQAAHACLPAAAEEIALLRSLQSAGATFVHLPARRRKLYEAFEQGGFDVLHLACHGTFGGSASADATAVLLEDGLFQAAELSPRMEGALRREMPLIFFNACHSGRLGFSPTGLGSWGARLVLLGCGGFIGSLWPVTDTAALAFARAFYGELIRGCAIGEAVARARREVREAFPGDPTWLAYCCFADPMAQLERREGEDGSIGASTVPS